MSRRYKRDGQDETSSSNKRVCRHEPGSSNNQIPWGESYTSINSASHSSYNQEQNGLKAYPIGITGSPAGGPGHSGDYQSPRDIYSEYYQTPTDIYSPDDSPSYGGERGCARRGTPAIDLKPWSLYCVD